LQQAQDKMLHFQNTDRPDKNCHVGEVIYEKTHRATNKLISRYKNK